MNNSKEEEKNVKAESFSPQFAAEVSQFNEEELKVSEFSGE